MANNKEHLEVTSHEQATIIFLGLRDKLSRTVLRGLVEGEPWLTGEPGREPLAAAATAEENEGGRRTDPEDAPDGDRTVILDDFLREEGEAETFFEGEEGDDYFSTVMKIGSEEISVVLGPDPTVYALPRDEVLQLINQQLSDQSGPAP
jgi:hypothetical protein